MGLEMWGIVFGRWRLIIRVNYFCFDGIATVATTKEIRHQLLNFADEIKFFFSFSFFSLFKE